jgi:hypothetical protein
VEALPADLPEHIEINIEGLSQIDDSLTIADLKAPTGVGILAEPTEMVFRIAELVSEEAEELAAEEEAAAEAASEETTAEGEKGAEGETTEAEDESKEESADAEKASE